MSARRPPPRPPVRHSSRRYRREESEREEDEDDFDEDIEENAEDEPGISGLVAMGYGVLRALKGTVGLVASMAMGISGLGSKEVAELLNSPFPDWWALWQKKQKELNQNRELPEMLWKGFVGFFTGGLEGVFNALKEICVGVVQAAFGGLVVVKILQKIGLPPSVVKAAVKSGSTWGLCLGIVTKNLDTLKKACEELQPKIEQYKSLAHVGEKALAAVKRIQRGEYSEALREGLKDFEGFQEVADRHLSSQQAAQARRWMESGRDLSRTMADPRAVAAQAQRRGFSETQAAAHRVLPKAQQTSEDLKRRAGKVQRKANRQIERQQARIERVGGQMREEINRERQPGPILHGYQPSAGGKARRRIPRDLSSGPAIRPPRRRPPRRRAPHTH